MVARKNNRFYLLHLRKQRQLVRQGITVLTGKRDALMKEVRGMIPQVTAARGALENTMRRAVQMLETAAALEPQGSIDTAAGSAQREIVIPVSSKNIWGVKVPLADPPDTRRDLYDRGSAPLYRNPAVDEAAARFEHALNALTAYALLQSRLDRIGGALKSTGRRVNALEQKVIPEMEADIAKVETYLEEMAREDIFRMKRYKSIRRKRTKSS